MKLLLSLARNKASSATSRGCPTLFNGRPFINCFLVVAGSGLILTNRFTMSVQITPGQMQFALIPRGPSSTARFLVSEITAPLVAP